MRRAAPAKPRALRAVPLEAARTAGAASAPGLVQPAETERVRGRAADVPLLGRSREVAEPSAALDPALIDGGRVVLLGGEPGIGKTRLARTLAREAEARGVPVWWGRGSEDGAAPAFWPWSTALRRWLDRGGREAAVREAGAFTAELARVFPALLDDCPEPASPSDAALSDTRALASSTS